MEQLLSQMTQLSVHLLQPRTFRGVKRDSNKLQFYACKQMGHISRDCPSRDVSGNRNEQGGISSRRVPFADDSGRGCGQEGLLLRRVSFADDSRFSRDVRRRWIICHDPRSTMADKGTHTVLLE